MTYAYWEVKEGRNGAKTYKCAYCGWSTKDKNVPKTFCPSCGSLMADISPYMTNDEQEWLESSIDGYSDSVEGITKRRGILPIHGGEEEREFFELDLISDDEVLLLIPEDMSFAGMERGKTYTRADLSLLGYKEFTRRYEDIWEKYSGGREED